MAFPITMAPGVRITASARGIQAMVRRPHRFTDAQMTLYRAMANGRPQRATTAAGYRRQIAALDTQPGAVQRLAHARGVAESFLVLLNLHRHHVARASPPVVPAPAQPDRAAIALQYQRTALEGIGVFRRSDRAAARQRAAEWTDAEVRRQWDEACAAQAEWQRYLNARWQQLHVNVPDVVTETLDEAFEAHELPSAVVGVDGDEVSLAVLVPTVDDAVPDQIPVGAPGGGTAVRRVEPRDRVAYYLEFVAGHVLATVREAFAVAPALRAARVAVIRWDDTAASCLLAARFERSWLDRVDWPSADAARIVGDFASELVSEPGGGDELWPIDLSQEPWLAALVHSVDLR